MTAKPNAADDDGNTLIYWAAFYGLTEIVKILVPLTDNPNAADNQGKTPIYWAAYKGHTEIVKILAPLTANPNAEDEDKDTPILIAARHGYSEIVKILAPLTILMLQITMEKLPLKLPKMQKFENSLNLSTLLINAKLDNLQSYPQNEPRKIKLHYSVLSNLKYYVGDLV